MIEVAILSPENVSNHWGELHPFVERAAEASNGEITSDGVLQRLLIRELIIAPVFRSGKLVAAVTFEQVDFDSGKKVMNIQLASGDYIDEWFEKIEEIASQLAEVQGCSEVYVIGRAGWQRKLKGLGYTVAHTVLRKEIK